MTFDRGPCDQFKLCWGLVNTVYQVLHHAAYKVALSPVEPCGAMLAKVSKAGCLHGLDPCTATRSVRNLMFSKKRLVIGLLVLLGLVGLLSATGVPFSYAAEV